MVAVVVSLDSVVVASAGQVSCDLSEEAAILNLNTNAYYGLNPLGARIWHLIQQPARVSEVRDIVLAEYDVEPKTLERDLLGFLGSLEAEDLIEIQS